MQIKVTGNTEYFRDHINETNRWRVSSFSIIGPFGRNYHAFPYHFFYDQFQAALNWFDLRKLADSIRGCDFNEILPILTSFGINYPNRTISTYQESGLIKAIFNILVWLESDLIEMDKEAIKKDVFNEFILDYSSKKVTQEDIYFVPREISGDQSNEEFFKIMLLLNLICSFEITYADGGMLRSFFLPFSKIGVNHLDFTSLSPMDGPRAFLLYRQLLGYRDTKIRNTINKK